MTSRITQANEVYLNATRFQLAGPVISSLISVYPPKFITGDYGKDSHQNISVQTWNDHRGGMGIERWSLEHNDRCLQTGLDIRHRHHLFLRSAHGTNTPTGMTDGIPLIGQLGSDIVSANGTDVQDWSGSAWTSRRTLGAAPTDVINVNLGGTEYLVFALGATGYEYSSSIASWSQSTKAALNIAFWDYRFWGIDVTGQLWYTHTMGSKEVNDARVFLTNNEVITGLFEARARNEEFILYVVTSKRLLAHDAENQRFIPISAIVLPDNNVATHERPAVVWRERIYLAAGRGIIEYGPVLGTYREIGFDLDDGMPAGEDGLVSCLAAGPNELFAGTAPVSSSDDAVIMGWDGQGWRKTLIQNFGDIYSLHVSGPLSSLADPQLWNGQSEDANSQYLVGHLRLNNSSMNPRSIDDWAYGSGGSGLQHIFPHFDAGQSDITKIALRLKVEVEGATTARWVILLVGFDGATPTRLTDTHTSDSTFDATDDRIEGDGITTFLFPDKNAATGTEFRTIQVVIQMNRTTDGSPDVVSVTLEYFKVLDPKYGFDFDLDLNSSYSNQSPQAARALLVAAAETITLVEFTFRDDDSNTRNYYVNIKQVTGMEETGHNERGLIHVRVEEP